MFINPLSVLRGDFVKPLIVPNTIAVMFRHEIIVQVGGFNEAYTPAEDYYLLLSAASLFTSVHDRTVVAQYRRYETSPSRRGVAMLRAMDRIMEDGKTSRPGKSAA
jgi:hypothetical protein